MANEELPQRRDDDDPPAHPQTEATDSSRPAQRGRHDIVEEADDGFFWPTVDDLLTIDFSTDLTGLDEATGWDPSVIPDLAAASAREAESTASVGADGSAPGDGSAERDGAGGGATADGAAIPIGEAIPLFEAKVPSPEEETPSGPGLFDDPVRVPADGIGTGAAAAAGMSEPFVGRVSGPVSFGDDIVDAPESRPSTALEPVGPDPLFAPVPTEKGVDFDFFAAATHPAAGGGVNGSAANGGGAFGLLEDASSVVVPERTPFTPASSGLSTVDLVRDMADRRWFTTAAVGAIAIAVGVIGWTNVVSGRSGAEVVADQPVDSTTTTDAPATTTPSITATILPPTTEILTTSTATNTTLPPTRPRPTTVPAPTEPAPPATEGPAPTPEPTPAPTTPAPTDPPTTPAPTDPPTTPAPTDPPTTPAPTDPPTTPAPTDPPTTPAPTDPPTTPAPTDPPTT
ncbi:MAG: hypothetical protein AAGD35_16880, partial [Actinomycetota bacterium]